MSSNEATLHALGLNELIKDLRKAGYDVSKFKDVHAKIGEIVESRAKQLVPKKSRTLGNSIRNRPTQRLTKIHYGGARIPYAAPVHWGWKKRGIKPSLFATRAAKETEPQWSELYFKEIEKILDEIKGLR